MRSPQEEEEEEEETRGRPWRVVEACRAGRGRRGEGCGVGGRERRTREGEVGYKYYMAAFTTWQKRGLPFPPSFPPLISSSWQPPLTCAQNAHTHSRCVTISLFNPESERKEAGLM